MQRLAGPWGLGQDISLFIEVRRGQKLLWVGGGVPGVGGLVAAAGAKGAWVTSGQSPLSLRGVTNPHPEMLGGLSGRPDIPLSGFLGSVDFYLVTL